MHRRQLPMLTTGKRKQRVEAGEEWAELEAKRGIRWQLLQAGAGE